MTATLQKEPFVGKAKNRPARNTLMLPYQSRFIKDTARLILVEKARQIGFSWATAYKLVSTTSRTDARQDDWVSSRDDLQARLLIEDCKNFAGLLSIAAQDLGERIVDAEKNSAYVLQYTNGHRTHSLSSPTPKPASAAGVSWMNSRCTRTSGSCMRSLILALPGEVRWR